MILVTGATGHLGSHLLYELAKANGLSGRFTVMQEQIRIVRKIFSYYQPDYPELFNSIEWVKADINDYHTLTNVCRVSIRFIILPDLCHLTTAARKNLTC